MKKLTQECWIATDTANSPGSVAISTGNIAEVRSLEGTASDVLMPTLITLLSDHNLQPHDITHLACHQGPGGFTGLRVGASIMQGLSWGLQKPLWGACGLEAAAEVYHSLAAAQSAKVWVVQDARLEQVYWGQFEWQNDRWRCHQPPQLSLPEDMIAPSSEGWVGISSGWTLYPELQQRHAHLLTNIESIITSNASAILSVARRWAQAGVAGNIGQIELNYLRNQVAQTIEERATAKLKKGL